MSRDVCISFVDLIDVTLAIKNEQYYQLLEPKWQSKKIIQLIQLH